MYAIPFNFAQKGKVFNILNTANIIETLILGGLAGCVVYFTPIPTLYGFIFGVLPICVFTMLGINNLSLCTFIRLFIKYHKSSNQYTFPTMEDRVRRNKMIAQRKRKKIKDMEKQKKLDAKKIKKDRKVERKNEKKRRKTGKRTS